MAQTVTGRLFRGLTILLDRQPGWGSIVGACGLVCVVLVGCQTASRGGISSAAMQLPEGSRAWNAQLAFDQGLEAFAMLRVHGGWPMAYSTDLSRRWGEFDPCDEWQITVQPPATPRVGEVYLRAAKVTGNRKYLRIAREAADILMDGQLANGGWWHEIRLDAKGPAEYYYLKDRGNHEKADLFCTATLDDRTTQGAIDFMMRIAAETGDRDYQSSAKAGLDFLLAAQYPQGGWPQHCPPGNTGYHRYLTLNDGASTDAMTTLLRGFHQYNDPRYLNAVLRAADWLIAFQLPEPHRGWAQQYALDGQAAPARWFEPPACCSAVTANVIDTLIEVYLETGDKRYLDPIPDVIAWFEKSEIRPGVWARFYEVGTNRPIYVNANREVVYEQVNLRPGYSWEGGYATAAIENYQKLMRLQRIAYLKDRQFITPEEEVTRFGTLEREVDKIAAEQTSEGYWVAGDRISCGAFVQACDSLCEYLELWGKKSVPTQ
ncbi:MAG: pectate lyase [bacterium]